MRCLAFVCLCLAVASAQSWNKPRFMRLLNKYQRDPLERLGGFDRFDSGLGGLDRFGGGQDDWENTEHFGGEFDQLDNTDELLHDSDELDGDYVPNEYMGESRREKYLERCLKYGDERCETTEGGMYHDIEGIDTEGIDSELPSSFDITGERKVSHLSRVFGYGVAKDIEEANTKLASRLYKQCKDERDDKNTVVSPVAIQLALAALNKGARGETKRQIAKIIAGRVVPAEKRQQVFKTILRSLKGLRSDEYSSITKRSRINCVTGIFISQTTPAQQRFIQILKGTLGVNVRKCNFNRQPQQCRQMINRWVSERTHQTMRQIVPKDAVTDNTKMIIVNALQLKANWGKQMRKHVIKPTPFYPLESEKVKIVEMLQTRGVFKYYEDELVKIVGVPTEQKEMTLYVIVPKHKDGLTQVEKIHLQDGEELKQLLQDADKRVKRVHVQLPKFEIKHKVDVRRTLLKQGVTDPFDTQRADFSGITGVSPRNKEYANEYETENDAFDTVDRLHRRRPYRQQESENLYDESSLFNEEIVGGKKNLHLNKFIHQATIKITESGITSATGSGSHLDDTMLGGEEDIDMFSKLRMRSRDRESFEDIVGGYRTSMGGDIHRVKADRAFAFVLKHNPTQQLLLVGRVIDAAQKSLNRLPLTIDNVDQL